MHHHAWDLPNVSDVWDMITFKQSEKPCLVLSLPSHHIPPHATRFIYRSRFPLVCSCSFFFVLFLSSVSDDGCLLQSGSCVSVMGVRGSANKFNGELAHFAPDQGAGWTDRLRGPCGDSPALPFDGFVRCQSPSLLANGCVAATFDVCR